MEIEKIKILGTVCSYQLYSTANSAHLAQFLRLDWHCCLAGSSKMVHRILISSIAIGSDYSYELKNSEIWAPAFFKHKSSFIAIVYSIKLFYL